MSKNPVMLAKRMAWRMCGWPLLGPSILVYHRIAKQDFDPFRIAIEPTQFERQLINLRKKTVLPLREFVALHRKGKLPSSAVALTFDDGYACNALTAAPMLAAFGVPATFFVVSEAIEKPNEFWWDELELIVRSPQFVPEATIGIIAMGAILPRSETYTAEALYRALWIALRDVPAAERRQAFKHLRQRMGLEDGTRPTHRPMTSTELHALTKNQLFEIGAHTASHCCLKTVSLDRQKEEIFSGLHSLQALVNKPILAFSYPYGEWSPATRDIVKKAGFEYALGTENRRVASGDDPFVLPRRQVVS